MGGYLEIVMREEHPRHPKDFFASVFAENVGASFP